jgi:predicted Rossmann fold nucleotide-binding protein DprA/Smf involved in DNA uptake
MEVNGMSCECSGTVQDVVPQILQFLTQAVPAYDLAKKLVYAPDLACLADQIAEFAKMTSTGQLLLTNGGLSAERAVIVILFMAQLAGKMGRRAADALSIDEIAAGVGRSPKTIRNVLVQLQRAGLIDRADRGRYRITSRGLMELEHSMKRGPKLGGFG